MKMFMRWLFLLVGVFFFHSLVQGQVSDSVFQLKDYEKIPYINRLLRQSFAGADEKKVLAKYEALQEAADKKDDAAVRIAALVFLAQYYTQQNNLAKAQQYYEEGLELSHLRRLKYLEPVMLHLTGNNAYKQDRYASGLEKLLRAHTLMENLGYSYFPDIADYLYDLGYAYFYNYQDLAEAQRFVKNAMEYPMPGPETEIAIYNTLGLIYRYNGETKLSDSCFNVALRKAEAIHDTTSIGDITGNIGYNHMQAGRLTEAETFLHRDYDISVLRQNWASACLAKLSLSSIALERNNVAASFDFIQQTRTLLNAHSAHLAKKSLYTICYFLYMNLSKTTRLQGKDKALIQALDSMILYKDSLFRSRESFEKASVQIKLIKESNQYQLELLRSEEKRNNLLRNALIIICLLVTVVAIQNVHRLKRDNRNNEEKLREYANVLVEKNQVIEQFKDEMQQLRNQPEHVEHEIEDIFKELRSHTILSEDDWQRFKQLFEKVYKNFFSNITQTIPGITQSEIRLLALTKLGLSTKEMADMQGVAADSIRKARYRLRKKIELHVKEDKDIAQVLNEL
jgi:DNA-binding CsgD family transcriptional regulator